MISLKELQDMWTEDSKIDELNLGQESTKTPELHAKYLAHMSQVRLSLRKAEASLLKLRRVKAQYYRGELSKEELDALDWEQYLGPKPLKQDINEMLDADNDVIEQTNRVEYIKVIADYLERIMRSLNSRTWDIKNTIEWTKFTNGLM
ncbi:MAG: hypothetical protein CBB97_11260 [Candidatus Endolissoclinum sp. TMED37]|nr:MAG: hypothetical protein CBB97_11260 [Candidatus Endolissoclinum sp. TMED37]|tara:strand:- start:317 stop:760 length:444 start_codon:yes stop_codon:yes gene_type:complete